MEALADRWHVVILLRLVVSAPDKVIYGELVDPDTEHRHQFQGWPGLYAALQARVRAAADERYGEARQDFEMDADTGGRELG